MCQVRTSRVSLQIEDEVEGAEEGAEGAEEGAEGSTEGGAPTEE